MSLPLAAWAQHHGLDPLTTSENEKAAIDGLYYELQQSGSTRTATVTYEKKDENGMYRSSYAGDVVIPEKVKHKGRTYKVESVGKGAFANCPELTSVTLPSGVEAIGDIAFGNCTGLKSVNIPCSVSRIGEGAFYACAALQRVDFEEADSAAQNHLTLGESVFYGCQSLEQVYICSTSQPLRLPSMVFAECRRLRSFKTLGTISDLGSGAFQNCTSLTGVDFDRIEWAAKDAFDGCIGFSEDDTAKWNAILEKEKAAEEADAVPDDDEPAEFPGDVYAWLAEHIQYPKKIKELRIQGRVSVQFIISPDGSITDVKGLRGPDKELIEEAVRVVRSMPKWKPATRGGKPVRMRYVLPVIFRLP